MKYGCSRAYLAVRRFSGFQFKRHSRRFMESSSSLKNYCWKYYLHLIILKVVAELRLSGSGPFLNKVSVMLKFSYLWPFLFIRISTFFNNH